MSVKSQEGYTVVECDEIEGSNNVSTMGDDFTVETALEDLEFGFTVIKNTQQVSKIESFTFLTLLSVLHNRKLLHCPGIVDN